MGVDPYRRETIVSVNRTPPKGGLNSKYSPETSAMNSIHSAQLHGSMVKVGKVS
jgi:hypothetical protein